MARYPGTDRERRVEPELLKHQVAGIFAGCGMSDADASLLADSLVQVDLRGIHSHGVLRVGIHCRAPRTAMRRVDLEPATPLTGTSTMREETTRIRHA